MAVTMDDIRRELGAVEPDYERAVRLGPDALPLLAQLVQARDPGMGSKSAYLAGLIGGPQAMGVLRLAAKSPFAEVRVAAASTLVNLKSPTTYETLTALIGDESPTVRAVALEAAANFLDVTLIAKVREVAYHDREAFLRESASNILERFQ